MRQAQACLVYAATYYCANIAMKYITSTKREPISVERVMSTPKHV